MTNKEFKEFKKKYPGFSLEGLNELCKLEGFETVTSMDVVKETLEE